MDTVYLPRIREVKLMKAVLEKSLNLKISINGQRVFYRGEALDEYDAQKVFDAIAFGFSVKKALLLKKDEYEFRKIHLKEFSNRSLQDIRARLIGKEGKSKRILSDLSGCEIIIGDSDVGIIGDAESMEDIVTAVTHIIRGSKHSNMYRYLEKNKNKTRPLD